MAAMLRKRPWKILSHFTQYTMFLSNWGLGVPRAGIGGSGRYTFYSPKVVFTPGQENFDQVSKKSISRGKYNFLITYGPKKVIQWNHWRSPRSTRVGVSVQSWSPSGTKDCFRGTTTSRTNLWHICCWRTDRPIALWLLTCIHTYGVAATDVHTNYNAVVGDVHTDLLRSCWWRAYRFIT